MWVGLAALAGLVAIIGGSPRAAVTGLKTEMLTGAAARAHIEQKERQNARFREALRESREELRAMGFRATGQPTVIRVVADLQQPVWARLAALVVSPVSAQAYGDGSGEIVFDTWDDGNHATWEGHVYVEDYQTGLWSSFNTQFEHYASTQSGDVPRTTWIGRTEIERDARQWAWMPGPAGRALARLGEVLVPPVCAQTSDDLSCGSDPRQQVERFMQAGFRRVRDSAFTILAGASLAGFVGGPHAFVGAAGFQVWGHMLQGYVNEFNRFYYRCH